MTAFQQALGRSPWRVRLVFDAPFAGMADAATYALARADGAGTSVTVSRAFNVDTRAVEIALSEALLERVIYRITAAGVAGSIDVAWQSPIAAATTPMSRVGDPEAEAFGVDLDWLANGLDGSGNVPETRGTDCLRRDLAARAMTVPGELSHRPDVGAGMPKQVNGPASLSEIDAALRREWSSDDRVKSLETKVQMATDGTVTASGFVTPIALEERIPVEVRRG